MHKKFKKNAMVSMLALISSAGILAGCGGSDNNPGSLAQAQPASVDTEDAALKFDAASYTTINITVDGVPTKVRQYRVVYVAKPIKMASTQATLGGGSTTLTDPYAYQSMIISVPEASINDQKTALYMAVNNGGWWTSAVSTTVTEGKSFTSSSDTDNIGAALKAGYVVVNVGTRSRGARAEDGRWAGKAPSPVVDTKAAIRYMRLNDSLIPGSAERIVLTGTSGGGGLTAAVAASGNSTDYLPYLSEVGAAGIDANGTSTLKDDVFAAVAYCPINNLGNADAGYEWQYSAVRSDANTGALGGVAYSAGPQRAASAAIAAKFPGYVDALGLGVTSSTMADAIVAHVKDEIERQIAKGTAVPQLGGSFVTSRATLSNDWLTLTGSGTSAKVSNIDYAKFLSYVAANQSLKTVVAFDAAGVNGNPNISGETNLFGTDGYEYTNFTQWSWDNNEKRGDGSGKDDTGLDWNSYLNSGKNSLAQQIKLINPIAYLNTSADSAPYWYVRHGMVDRDTSFAMQVLLYQAIRKDPSIKDVNFKLPYLVGHSGNYDVQEAFSWIKAKMAATP